MLNVKIKSVELILFRLKIILDLLKNENLNSKILYMIYIHIVIVIYNM